MGDYLKRYLKQLPMSPVYAVEDFFTQFIRDPTNTEPAKLSEMVPDWQQFKNPETAANLTVDLATALLTRKPFAHTQVDEALLIPKAAHSIYSAGDDQHSKQFGEEAKRRLAAISQETPEEYTQWVTATHPEEMKLAGQIKSTFENIFAGPQPPRGGSGKRGF